MASAASAASRFDPKLHDDGLHGGPHEAPPDVYVANIDGTKRASAHRRQHVRSWPRSRFSKAERLRCASYDGTLIEGWLMYPVRLRPGPTGPYPLIVISHGGPHSATGYSFDFKNQYFAANGYFVLDTNFRSSTGYGEAFKWATWGAWGDRDGEDVMCRRRLRHRRLSDRPQSGRRTPAIRTAGS